MIECFFCKCTPTSYYEIKDDDRETIIKCVDCQKLYNELIPKKRSLLKDFKFLLEIRSLINSAQDRSRSMGATQSHNFLTIGSYDLNKCISEILDIEMQQKELE